jgi:DNA polymerase-1
MSRSLSPTKERIALIDADGILYAAALAGETTCDGEQMQMLDISYVYKDCLKRIQKQVDWTGADQAFICLSDRTVFRTDILPTYKAKRKATPRPLLLDELRSMVSELAPYKVMLVKNLEADDVCGIASGNLQAAGKEPVIVSPDKDMRTIPGLLLVPPKAGLKPKIEEITEDMADRFHMMQTLMGDVTDNYVGCPGVGAAKAEALLAIFDDACQVERWNAIVAEYERRGFTEADALIQARVSRILRVSDWDTVKKEVRLWDAPR